MSKLPLASSLSLQQHALARHEAGDQPKEGVSRHLHIILYMKFAAFSCQVLTAPKPKQPTTPFAEGGKQLPWEVSPDALDGPPNMLDTPPESPDIVSLSEAPWSEPGSPKVKTTVP